jgi:VWFA-related protein
MVRASLAGIAAWFSAIAILAGAQSPVAIAVTALDAKGRPVTDLTGADLQIFDDGQLRPDTSVRLAAPSTPKTPSAVLILLDLLNAVPTQRNYAVTHIVRALEPLETGNSAYLYILTNQGDVYPVHALPTPRPTIRMAGLPQPEEQAQPSGSPWTLQVHALLERAIRDVLARRPMDDKDEGIRAMATFRAMGDLGNQFMRIRGPKTIVWITRGAPNVVHYPYGCRDVSVTQGGSTYLAGKCRHDCSQWADGKCIDFAPFLGDFSRELAAGDTIIYSVEETFTGSVAPAAVGNGDETLRKLVDLTGGRMYSGGEVEKAIAQSRENAGARYQFAYTAPSQDGKYHKLRVVSTRKGVRIEARKGYFAAKSE